MQEGMSMHSNYQKLKAEVEKGILGKNQGIPISLKKAGKYLSIRQAVYTLLGGHSGTGKTAYADSVYVLEPYQWYLDNKDTTHLKIQWVYRSMERPILQKLAKWACYKIWKEHAVLIVPDKLLGWTDLKLSGYEKDLFDSCEEFFETMQDSGILTIVEGQDNPRGIWKHLEEYALQRGVYEQKSEYERVYHPTDPNLIVVPVIDHAGKCKMETVDGIKSRKGTTDKLSEYMSISRDLFKMSPVVVSQFNRSIKSEIYNKQSDPEPTMESFKETGNLYEDCDVALSLFNPYKFKIMDHMGHDIPKFVDTTTGANYFRSLKMIKNQGEDDIRWALAFMGQIGFFKDLPKVSEMDDSIALSVKDHAWFLPTEEQEDHRKVAFSGFGANKTHKQ